MTLVKSKRLARTDWLAAGMAALIEQGPDALKAEPLARRLGTTKGSFYWHFKDVPAFHAALLKDWETAVLAHLDEILANEYSPVGRLRRFGQTIADTSDVEPAIRAWAKGNGAARSTIRRVDGQRQALLRELLEETDIGNPEMMRIIYAAGIGMKELDEDSDQENARTMGSLVDLVLALR